MEEAGGLTLRVLGDLDASGTLVELGGRRQRAVLAALIIARGEVVSAERLAECVWGDGAGARHSGGLQSYISHLRALLQPDSGARSRNDVIARAGFGYALLREPAGRRRRQFEHTLGTVGDLLASERVGQLSDTLGLWRGPAFAEYADEPWAETEVARLTELRTVARENLMDARLAVGDAPLLVPELEALVAEDPLREERWLLLVLARYRANRQGDALAALASPGPAATGAADPGSGTGRRAGTGTALTGAGRAGAVARARRAVPDAAHFVLGPRAGDAATAAPGRQRGRRRPVGPGRSRPRTVVPVACCERCTSR